MVLEQPAHLPKAEIRGVAQDDVVRDVDAHQPSRVEEPLGQDHIITARRRIARGMIVKQDDRCGGGRCRFTEHFARMDDRRVE